MTPTRRLAKMLVIQILLNYHHRGLRLFCPKHHRRKYFQKTIVYGIGFQMADWIAEKLGFEKTAPVRAEAGILYLLGQFSEEGHVYYPMNSS